MEERKQISRRIIAIDAFVVASLLSLEAEQLDHLGPETNRRINESGFVSIDDGAFPGEIGLVGLHEFGALEELPPEEQDGGDDLHGVIGEEVGDVPGQERGVAVAENHNDHPHQTDVGAVRLEPAGVR